MGSDGAVAIGGRRGVRPLQVEAVLLGLALFALYAAGACRTIYVGDSGELVAAVHTLGIPHPTGYPLYVLLGKLWTLAVPVGSVAFRMSLFSAACAAGAAAGLYALARALGLARAAALGGALLLAFSPSFWAEANVQRVYALNAVFVVAALAAALAWRRGGEDRWLVLAFFLCGLGASNHVFMGMFGLVLAGWAPFADRSLLRRGKTVAAAAGAGVLGLLPYLYLPLRSRQEPRLDWGDPEGLGAFLGVVLRRDFWERAWVEGPRDLLTAARDYLGSFGEELLWAGALLAIVGLLGLALASRRGRVGPRPPGGRASSAATFPWLLLALLLANFLVVALHGSRADLFLWHRYYLPSYAIASLLAAVGVAAVGEWIGRAARGRPWRAAAVGGWPLLALALPAVLLVRGYPRFDRSRYAIAEDFSRTLLASLPPGAHLAASDDNILFVLIYLQLVEGVRPDVDLILQGVGGADLPPLHFDPDEEPLFFTHHPNWRIPALEVVPVGLAFRILRSGAPLPPLAAAIAEETELQGESDPRVPRDYLTSNLIGHFHYMQGLTHEARGDWPAAAELARAARAAPDNDVLFYNLGLVYARAGLYDRALAAFSESRRINPRHLATSGRVRAADRIAELAAERERLDALERRLALDAGLEEPEGSAERHLRLAALLAERGELAAARGHRLQAQEAESAMGQR